MKSKVNSIHQNGCSVCAKGEEKYTAFSPAHRPKELYYQYDYRHINGELFSAVAPSLEQCRAKRDKWVQSINYKHLYQSVLKKIQDKKRLTKFDMAYQIGKIEPYHSIAVSWDYFTRDEIAGKFNQMFGTEIN
jgi:hypothetical protein